MSGMTPRMLERLLADLHRELRPLDWRARRRALAEVRDHLLCALEDELASGASMSEAEQRATERFGDAARISEALRSGARGRAAKARRVACRIAFGLMAAAGGIEVVRIFWDGGSTSPAAPITRICIVAIVVTLVALPWVTRPQSLFGPAANGWARVVRGGAYGALWALPLVARDLTRFAGARFDRHAFANSADEAQWHAETVHRAVFGSVVLFVLIAAYAIGILWLTSRRSSAGPSTLAVGGGIGVISGLAVFALTPFGGFLHVSPWLAPLYFAGLFCAMLGAPVLAGQLAGDRTAPLADPVDTSNARVSQGAKAGLCTGVVAALLIAILTIPTMVHFPHRVALEWANPDPHAPHGGTFEVRMSVGDGAQKYLALLFLGPFLAAGLGALGGDLRRRPQAGLVLDADGVRAVSEPAG